MKVGCIKVSFADLSILRMMSSYGLLLVKNVLKNPMILIKLAVISFGKRSLLKFDLHAPNGCEKDHLLLLNAPKNVLLLGLGLLFVYLSFWAKFRAELSELGISYTKRRQVCVSLGVGSTSSQT